MVPKSDTLTVHGDCDERVSEVSVRVGAFQRSEATDASEVSVRPLYAQTFAGIVVIAEASVVICVFVLVLIVLTADETCEPVFALTACVIELDALFTSDTVASDPDDSEAPVSVRAP
jgi:hypothetical protein